MKTPALSHLKKEIFDSVYEPMEDTFLMLDTLEEELEYLRALNPRIVMEIGSGSGCVITFCSQLLLGTCMFIASDINPRACQATIATSEANGQTVDCIRTRFSQGLRVPVDLLLFNPPYVVTPSKEVGSYGIAASWAGGIDGMEVTNAFLNDLDEILSDKGTLYLILINENHPEEVISRMRTRGFVGHVLKYRVAGREGLSCIRFTRCSI